MPAKSPKNLPTIEYYWTNVIGPAMKAVAVVNVRIKAANGLQVAQITQGFRDKTDARRGVEALAHCFRAYPNPTLLADLIASKTLKEVGPGPKPKLGDL